MQLHRTKLRKKSHLLIGIICLAGLLGLIIFTSPQNILLYSLFFSLLLVSQFYLVSFLLGHTRRALLTSMGITLLLLLRATGLRHWLYAVLVIAVLISLEFYFRKK